MFFSLKKDAIFYSCSSFSRRVCLIGYFWNLVIDLHKFIVFLHLMEEYYLSFHNLSIGYVSRKGVKCLAKELNGHLERGMLTCLIGLNGSGKSTLLRTLDGYQKPLKGEVLIEGKSLKSYSPRELAKRIGIVLTEKIPAEALTVYDIVSMGRLPYTGFLGKMRTEDTEMVNMALEKVKMTDFGQRRYYELSDGERQKVLIAKAIAQQTKVILLDEPLSFLDYPSKNSVLDLLYQMAHEDNLSILMSIHDLDLVYRWADCIWELKQGEMTQAMNTSQQSILNV